MAKKKAAKRKTPKKGAKKKSKKKAAEKNSLVANINRRKKAGQSRPKKKSTISDDAYRQMEQGWPDKKNGKKTAKKKAAP
jgi:hypothetical protein